MVLGNVLNKASSKNRKWKMTSGVVPVSARLCAELGVCRPMARLLQARSLTELSKAKDFLRPKLKKLHDPDLLPNIQAATDILCDAIRNSDGILLFGDYDVDGITGSAILERVLTALGGKVETYIPDRFTDGYGINVASLEKFFRKGRPPKAVVSIDNGVVAFSAADYLKTLGVNFVVADHHRMEEGRLPESPAILHPGLSESRYPNKNLCGAGVAFKLAWGTARAFTGQKRLPPSLQRVMLESMALVAMGTVADVMPLKGENRTFVKFGLEALESKPTPGLQALLDVAKVHRGISASTISFQLAPRINAAGRLGSGRRALDLLNSDQLEDSHRMADILDQENNRRREIEKEISELAKAQAHELYGEEPEAAGLVLAGKGWHEGVVGIVAARMVEEFNRPCVVLSILEGERVKGSGRSALNVDLKAALDGCKHHLQRYGGHEAAVGLSLKVDDLEAFREDFNNCVGQQLGVKVGQKLDIGPPDLRLDMDLDFQEITEEFVTQLQMLEPHGYGNRRPVFKAVVELAGSPKLMGKNSRHLSFFVRQKGVSFRAVMWSRADLFDGLMAKSSGMAAKDRSLRIAFRPHFNEFRGRRSIELTIQDLHLNASP